MTTNVTVLGASGQIARLAIPMLAAQPDVRLTLVARDRNRLGDVPEGARVIEGDVTDDATLAQALTDANVVYANLSGNVDDQARNVVDAMRAARVPRLIFVTSLGIYDEVPGAFGEWNSRQIGSSLRTYRRAADIVMQSDLDATNIRPAWLEDVDEIDYELTQRDEPFRGTVVSRKSVAALVAAIIADPALHAHADLGISKPGTDGPSPQFT